MKKTESKAYAKINLMLRVIGKRLSGYHNLQMVNFKIDLSDTVRLIADDTGSVRVDFYPEFEPENNIVEKIILDFKERFGIREGITAEIKKQIPLASGMGGGSADAAAVIHLLDEMFDLNLSMEDKRTLGLKYGADIPYMLTEGGAIVEGIGEQVVPISDQLTKEELIVNPGFPVSTKDIFQSVTDYSLPLKHSYIYEVLKEGNIEALIRNDLTKVVKKMYPDFAIVLNDLKKMTDNPVFMTGSGPTLVVLINKEIPEPKVKEFKNTYPAFYVQKHRII